jgi:hypothetical protein
MTIVQHDNMIQAIPSNAANYSLDKCIRVHRRLQSIRLIRRDVLRSLIHSTHTQGASLT